MKRILIIEDHKNTLEWLAQIVKEVDGDNEIFAVDNVTDAYEYAMTEKIDLFLVDIILDAKQMSDASGMTFVRNIREVKRYAFTPIIFISALADPEFYAYRHLHCYGYIEKPFDVDYVKELVMKALEFRESASPEEKIYFRQEGTIYSLDKTEIVYAESINHIIYVHMSDGSTNNIRYKTIKSFVKELDSPRMIQCSRSTIVNKEYIKNVDGANNIIQLKGGHGELDIGVTFIEYIRKLFKSKIKW